ncbi:MAG: hypothetical protein ACSLFL_09085 [Alphaproteobacteria bacterium]
MTHALQTTRPKSDGDYIVLKQATKRLIKACGGLEAASMVTRVGHSELARYYDPSEKLFMPIDVVADLEAISGNAYVCQSLAHMLGFSLVPLQPPEMLEPSHHWTALIAQLGEETASTLRQIGAALTDHGTLTAQSINHYQLARHLENLIQTAMHLKLSIAQRQERGVQSRRGQIPVDAELIHQKN